MQALCCVCVTAIAQTPVSTTSLKWSLVPVLLHDQIMEVSTHNSSGSANTEGIATGILKVNDNSIIANIQIDKNSYGVVRLNKDLSTQWLDNIDGYPIAIGDFNNNVLAIASTEKSSYKGNNNTYVGYIIDKNTGKVILQKVFYTSSDELYEQPVFLFSPDGSFFKMAIRTSTLTRKAHFGYAFNINKGMAAFFDTKEFKVIDFNTTLDVSNTINPVLQDGFFIGATTNKNGDIFTMTDYEQGYIEIARYEKGKTIANKVLKLPISMSDEILNNLSNTYLFTSKSDPSKLLFAMIYRNANNDKELVNAKFNFKTGSVDHNTQIIDKQYLKDLKKSYVPFDKKFDDVDLGNKDNMQIRNVIENDGKLIIALSSFTTSSGNSSRIAAYDILVNIYDDKANLQYQQIVPRSYAASYILYTGIGLHCKNNILYLTANNNKGIIGYKTIYSQIDLNSGNVLKITGVSKDGIKNSYAANPNATIWFDDQFIQSYIEERGLYDGSEDAHMQLLNY